VIPMESEEVSETAPVPAGATPRIGVAPPYHSPSRYELYIKDAWRAWDFRVSVAAGLLTLGFIWWRPAAFASSGVVLMATIGAVAAALLAVILTAMAIIGNISSSYRRALMLEEGGLKAALAPYQLVAAVCGATVLAALAGLALDGLGPAWVRAIGAGFMAFLVTWSVLGTVDLVNLTALHGRGDAAVDPNREPGSVA
jgi:hypothetical protein